MNESQNAVYLTVLFDALVDGVKALPLEDKNRLLFILEQLIGEEEEALLANDPTVQAAIQQARAEYEAGKYLSLGDYLKM